MILCISLFPQSSLSVFVPTYVKVLSCSSLLAHVISSKTWAAALLIHCNLLCRHCTIMANSHLRLSTMNSLLCIVI
ncbi:hypothetical protein RIF29_27142 [Crotalaria pallida]|uniref:Uncharacterized protein n=1 Tax=Crotalaria pallida TaxID=3830 RepID=A0AAN9I0R9_CROPI